MTTVVPTKISGPLKRFRAIAYVVGVGLLVLVLIGMPMKYIPAISDSTVVAVVGPIHGLLYMIYLALTFDLSMKGKWSPKGTILVLLAGTIPFLSFVAERIVTRKVKAGEKL